MTTEHPITPPPELVQQWVVNTFHHNLKEKLVEAARWGADAELEACCEEMKTIPSPLGIPFGEMASNALRAARRPENHPKPLSLKQQAKQAWLRFMDPKGHDSAEQEASDIDAIRRALEALPDD